jgi:hypothetical protein
MAIDMFATREMTSAMEQLYAPKTWLRDTIFGSTEEHTSQYVDIDVEKGSRQVAAYVSPLHEGKKVDKGPYEARTFKAPYTKNKMVTTAQEFLTRRPGQTIYAPAGTSGGRAQEQLGTDLRYLGEMIDRLEELQCSSAIQTGEITAEGEGIHAVINFQFDADQLPVLSGTDAWNDYTNSQPLRNMSDWFDLIDKKSGLVPANAILGREAMNDFIRNDEVKELLDNRRITLGQIDPSALKDIGVRYYGYLKDPGVDLWTYSAWYYDENMQKLKRYIDDDKVIMWGSGARATRHYGAIEDVDNFAITQRFAKSWVTKDPSARWVMVQAAPLCVPHQSDAFLCATVR